MTEDEIRAKARQILLDNNVRGYSKSTGIYFHYTKPSQKPYASQYFWDSCFHSFIWTALGEHDMAKAHLESLFALQEKEGFVGHIIYWNQVWPNRITDIFQSRPTLKKMFSTHSSALLEPPFIAQAVGNIYNNDKDIYFLWKCIPNSKDIMAGWLNTGILKVMVFSRSSHPLNPEWIGSQPSMKWSVFVAEKPTGNCSGEWFMWISGILSITII
jgi:hypothetical protein